MSQHSLRTLIETCDAAISRRDFDALMAFYAEDVALVVKPSMVVRGIPVIRRATYVFRKETDGQWHCTIDNSYGTKLLDAGV
ncbi:hypothetical protein CF111_07670 [Aeromonas sobria]|uniref:YybH family protein n=1 Tax=Aeromonas sobria TaxID=646 RepID=UPI0011189173|nr:hypothetical protein [Aeromonas sobria]TNJ24608.1 hypothetical protein CF111_07670 [Aeromonas sobria]